MGTGVLIPGGHSGAGLMQLRELAGKGYYDFYEPVSRRGQISNLGPATFAYEAMMSQNVIYHAKCDITDPMAFEDLMNYAPSFGGMYYDEGAEGPWISDIRAKMGDMDAEAMRTSLIEVETFAKNLAKQLKEAKRKVDSPSYKNEQEAIKQQVAWLEEQDVQTAELLADLTAALNQKK